MYEEQTIIFTKKSLLEEEYYVHNKTELGVASQAWVNNIPRVGDIYHVVGKTKDFYTITRKLRFWYPGDRCRVEIIFG